MSKLFYEIKGDVVPLSNVVLVSDLDFGERKTKFGIVVLDDDGKESGIKPRWAKVYKVGKNVDEVKPGEWVLINHGRWTRGVNLLKDGEILTIRMIDRNDILLASDEKPIF